MSGSCCNECLGCPLLFPHQITFLSPTVLTLHFATFFWHTLALVTIVTAVHTHMLQGCPFPAESATSKSSPFRLKFPRREQRPELVLMLLLPYLLQGKSLFRCSFSLLKVRNSNPRPLGQRNCASQPSRQCCKDAAPWQCGGIYPVPWDSHHTLWQRWNRATFLHCFILHVHLASRSDIQNPQQQPHHCSTTSVTLTNELHTWNCSHMLSSDSISPCPCYG